MVTLKELAAKTGRSLYPSQTRQAVYRYEFDQAAYDKYVQQQSQDFQQRFAQQTATREATLREQQAREQRRAETQARFRSQLGEQGSPAGVSLAKQRQERFAGRQQSKLDEFNAETQRMFEQQKSELEAQLKADQSKFQKKILTGYNVYTNVRSTTPTQTKTANLSGVIPQSVQELNAKLIAQSGTTPGKSQAPTKKETPKITLAGNKPPTIGDTKQSIIAPIPVTAQPKPSLKLTATNIKEERLIVSQQRSPIEQILGINLFGDREILTSSTTGEQYHALETNPNLYIKEGKRGNFGIYKIEGTKPIELNEEQANQIYSREVKLRAFNATSGTILPAPIAVTPTTAAIALAALKNVRFVTNPKTVATVSGDNILATTTYRVSVPQFIGRKEYEVVTKSVISKLELGQFFESTAPKIRAGVQKLALPEKTSTNVLRLEAGKEVLAIPAELPRNVGTSITDVVLNDAQLAKIYGKRFGAKSISVGASEELGQLVLTRSEGVSYVKPVGIIDRFVNRFAKQPIGLFGGVKEAEARVLASRKTVSEPFTIESATKVGNRAIGVQEAEPSKGVAGLVPVREGKVGFSIPSFSKKELGGQGLKVSVSGSKGFMASRQVFKDESVLLSAEKKFKGLEVKVATPKGTYTAARFKSRRLPREFVLVKPSEEKVVTGFGSEASNKVLRLGKGRVGLLSEPQKRLPEAQKLLPAKPSSGGGELLSDAAVESKLSRFYGGNAAKVVSGTAEKTNVSVGKGIAQLQKQELFSLNVSARSGTATLSRVVLKPSVQVSSKGGVSVVKPKESFRQSLNNELRGKAGTSFKPETRTYAPSRVSPVVELPRNRLDIVPRVSVASSVSQGGSVNVGNAQNYSFKGLQDLSQKQSIAQKFAQGQGVGQGISQSQAQSQARSQARSLSTPAITKTITTNRVAVPIVPVRGGIPGIPIPKKTKREFARFGSGVLKKAYTVFSRVRGKEVVLATGVPKNIATRVGASFAARTPARSFKIKEVGFTEKADVGLVNLSQFRAPKAFGRVAREGFTFVEKSKFAIDTIGEVRGISLKGGRARSRRRLV